MVIYSITIKIPWYIHLDVDKKGSCYRQLCLYRTFKEYWFLRKSKFTTFVNQERQSESVREWEIASAVQTGACQRVITAQGLWELQQWRFCDTGDIRACSLHHSRPCLRTQPHPRHLPSVTGLQLVWQPPPPLLHLYLLYFISLPFCALHLPRWFMDPTLRNHSAQIESERRDENQFFSSAPTSTDHFSVVKQKLLTSAI